MSVAADGLSLYFQSNRQVVGDTTNDPDIWSSTYNQATSTWAAPTKVSTISRTLYETGPSITGDALVYSVSMSGLNKALYMSYPAGAAPISMPDVNLPTQNTESGAFAPDFCSLYFVTDRAGGPGQLDVWKATRR
jgi:hypothetical protein